MPEPDAIVVGGGTAGCVTARRLIDAGRRVLLIEYGPDYGPKNSGKWPADLLLPNEIPTSHDAGFVSQGPAGQRIEQPRAHVIGGCSSHNHCAAVWGSGSYWDAWREPTAGAVDADRIAGMLAGAASQMRAHPVADDELRPFPKAFADAATVARGLPVISGADFCVPSTGRFHFGIDDGARYNAAFAYLDDIRDSELLTVVSGAQAEAIEVTDRSFSKLRYRTAQGIHEVQGGEVILCAGAYETPALLMRSGIGSPAALRAAGVTPVHELVCVGANLLDHPAVALIFEQSAELETLSRGFTSPAWMPRWQTFVKDRSSRCEQGLDIHIYPTELDIDGVPRIAVGVACMTPKSVGEVRIDYAGKPVIDHRYLAESDDVEVLLEGIELARLLFGTAPVAGLVGAELSPGPLGREDLRSWIADNVAHYFHPVGTCRIGVDETGSVIDRTGAVHGLSGVFIADASVMPVLPDANTNLPVAAVADLLVSARN